MIRAVLLLIPVSLLALLSHTAYAQCPIPTGNGATFDEKVVDVGNVGLTVTNAGFFGRADVRNNPTGDPSFEYPLNSGIEHLFEAGLWVGAINPTTGAPVVRTAAVTASGGYSDGAPGYEFAPSTLLNEYSSLLTADAYTPCAVSQQTFAGRFADDYLVLPGTSIRMPDYENRLGLDVGMRTYAWNYPFAESFVIVTFNITNTSDQPLDSVYVGLFHDLVVRNVNTTTDTGSNFFNKGGYGFVDSLQTTYAFNAGGEEETTYTYGAISYLGGQWPVPDADTSLFFHPSVANEYRARGLQPPYVNPRWWKFSGESGVLSRPGTDQDKFIRMSRPYPDPGQAIGGEPLYPGCEGTLDIDCQDPAYLQEVTAWREDLRTDGQTSDGNWIGLTPVGPFPSLPPGETLEATFAFVAALKPGAQTDDNAETRERLRENVRWARRTYAGEDNNYNGRLDPGEDINGNGRLDRFLIPEPPGSPQLRASFRNVSGSGETQDTRAELYWTRSAEESVDPVTGEQDFEGYRIYRSNPGDDRAGNIVNAASLVAQFDQRGNQTGYNTGFEEILLTEDDIPAGAAFSDRTAVERRVNGTTVVDTLLYFVFEDDPDSTRYFYHYTMDDLLNGWQYLVSVTAFDTGDPAAGLPSYESGVAGNALRIFPGTPAADEDDAEDAPNREVGVYPNPYRINAAWDGATARTRRLNFYNLPRRCTIRIYTLAGEVVATLDHDQGYQGNIRWYDDFSGPNRQIAGGEHSWDILSENNLELASGLYFYTVEDLDSGDTQRGKFVIIK